MLVRSFGCLAVCSARDLSSSCRLDFLSNIGDRLARANVSGRRFSIPRRHASRSALYSKPTCPQPASRQAVPIVIMAHGTSATITMVADRYAEALREAGFAILLYDHRNFGISDGEPRGELNPWIQARGYRDAIDYVCSSAEVDKSRVAIWGDSLARVKCLSACDHRVKRLFHRRPHAGQPCRRPG